MEGTIHQHCGGKWVILEVDVRSTTVIELPYERRTTTIDLTLSHGTVQPCHTAKTDGEQGILRYLIQCHCISTCKHAHSLTGMHMDLWISSQMTLQNLLIFEGLKISHGSPLVTFQSLDVT